MKLSDATWGVLLLLLSAALFVSGSRYGPIHGQAVGAGTFPMVLGAALAVCSITLIVRGWASKQPWMAFGAWVRSRPHASAFLVVVASLVFFALTADSLGYHIAVFACMLAMLLKLGNSIRSALLIALAVATISHLFFYKVLRVPLPWGVLPVIY